ncbi:hypothetical protein DRO66_05125 [Candidatus Bathyarchaeota archaeon]|nr:MAG: hypothetical protein DRO66_05125 [Candidatus Bathyarchaeota archaeon]
MATVLRKKDELKMLCHNLGIMETVKKKFAKTSKNPDGTPKETTGKNEYVNALAKHYLMKRYPSEDAIPQHLKLRLEIDSPMLAHRITAYKPEEQESVWEDDKFIFEEKMNGCRMLMIFVKGEGLHFYSRHVSVTDYLPIEYTNIWHDVDLDMLGQKFDSFIVDNEIMSDNPNISTEFKNRGVRTETVLQAVAALLQLNAEESISIQKKYGKLHLYGFDNLMVNGQWLIDLPYSDRRKVLTWCMPILKMCQMHYDILSIVQGKAEKKSFYNSIIEAGGEGVIAKDLTSLYCAMDKRVKLAWTKIKRTVGGSLGDEIEAYIVDGAPGDAGKGNEHRISKLALQVTVRELDGSETDHIIAWIANLSDAMMDDMTVLDDNNAPMLNPDYKFNVVAIDGQTVSPRNHRLTHAVFLGFRPDKTWTDCSMDRAFLKSMIM